MTSDYSSSVTHTPNDRKGLGPDYPETQKVIHLGQENGWAFTVLGQAPLPEEQVRLGRWLIVPADQDNTPVPPRSLERIQRRYLPPESAPKVS